MHKPLLVYLPIKTPVILGRFGTMFGDALLGGALWEQTEDPDAVERLECLRHTDSVAHAGMLMVEKPYRVVTRMIGHSLGRDLLSGSMANTDGLPKINSRGISLSNGPYRNILNSYTAYETTALWFGAYGDPAAILHILRKTFGVGSLRQKGSGLLDSENVAVYDVAGHDLFGLTDSSGEIVRPIPLRVAEKLSISGGLVANAKWKNPYRASPPEPCYVPKAALGFVTRRELKERFR